MIGCIDFGRQCKQGIVEACLLLRAQHAVTLQLERLHALSQAADNVCSCPTLLHSLCQSALKSVILPICEEVVEVALAARVGKVAAVQKRSPLFLLPPPLLLAISRTACQYHQQSEDGIHHS